jgi:hypothetical protein
MEAASSCEASVPNELFGVFNKNQIMFYILNFRAEVLPVLQSESESELLYN